VPTAATAALSATAAQALPADATTVQQPASRAADAVQA
jgi:hypothetical protein